MFGNSACMVDVAPALSHAFGLPWPLFIQQAQSAHSITTQGHLFQFCVALVISGVALELDGNQTDSFILKGGMDKATT
jgi:hypothetical protein